MITKAIFCLVPAFWLSASALAAEETPLTYDRIELTATATAEVDNDTLTAVLDAQAEGIDAQALAADVNLRVRGALERLKAQPEIRVQTLGYQTNPVYNKQTLSGWRVNQSLRIESMNAGLFANLIGELQKTLAVQSVGYKVSPEKMRQAEDRLIAQAIGQFKQRARLVAEQMGRSDYRLVKMAVETGGQPVFKPYGMRAAAMAMEMPVAPPAMEAGTQSIEVRVTGTIELQLK